MTKAKNTGDRGPTAGDGRPAAPKLAGGRGDLRPPLRMSPEMAEVVALLGRNHPGFVEAVLRGLRRTLPNDADGKATKQAEPPPPIDPGVQRDVDAIVAALRKLPGYSVRTIRAAVERAAAGQRLDEPRLRLVGTAVNGGGAA